MNRGRHRKKKSWKKITYEELINYINLIKNDYTFSNSKSNTPYRFNSCFTIDEQRKT